MFVFIRECHFLDMLLVHVKKCKKGITKISRSDSSSKMNKLHGVISPEDRFISFSFCFIAQPNHTFYQTLRPSNKSADVDIKDASNFQNGCLCLVITSKPDISFPYHMKNVNLSFFSHQVWVALKRKRNLFYCFIWILLTFHKLSWRLHL